MYKHGGPKTVELTLRIGGIPVGNRGGPEVFVTPTQG